MPESAPIFRDPSRLTLWVAVLFGAYVLVNVAWLVSDAMQLQLLASRPFTLEAAAANDTRQRIVGVLSLVVLVPSIVVFSMWVYRANVNARALGATGMSFTPGWAVGWYFVPIALFWKPYQAMKEIWLASKSLAGWSGARRTSLLPWWWFFWIVFSVLGNLSFRLQLSARTVEELVAATWMNMASSAASIPSAVLAAMLVRQVAAMQTVRGYPAAGAAAHSPA
jgi:hypothetical protein